MFGQYLKEVRRLMELKRYPTKIMIRKRSVAEHSWFVCEIAHGLALWEKNKFDEHKDISMERVMFLAQKHDIVEAYTGDIMPSVKDMSEGFREMLYQGERNIFRNHIVNTIPKSWGQSYVDLHQELSELKTVESRIVKAADLIDRVYECMDEILRGNTEDTENIIKSDLKRLSNIGLMSVDYFLKYSLKDIKNAYNYLPDDQKERLEALDFSKYF